MSRVIQFFAQQDSNIVGSGRMAARHLAIPIEPGMDMQSAIGNRTTVVQSAVIRHSAWHGSTGYRHAENMRIERYRRAHLESILQDITITDPKA